MVKSTPNRIKARREELGLSRERLAELLGTTRMTVWRVENGKTPLKTDNIKLWARALKTTAARLIA